ncbi:hypothetical protein BpHYR1_016125 [Brachionus plicatilis]|uniref:Uncharacterized protein n=1 Tax=Brachionus plicatilis TaxID=10195 RepID=A0A3M7QRF9_BRAPC|nr:hypothetical protein BpHYR1_016125 [Brachionus plicatilis]
MMQAYNSDVVHLKILAKFELSFGSFDSKKEKLIKSAQAEQFSNLFISQPKTKNFPSTILSHIGQYPLYKPKNPSFLTVKTKQCHDERSICRLTHNPSLNQISRGPHRCCHKTGQNARHGMNFVAKSPRLTSAAL